MKTLTGKDDLGVVERMAAGSLAGILSQSAIYPLEVLNNYFLFNLFKIYNILAIWYIRIDKKVHL